ncbi:tetratricopeptide repeat protein [Streptomyces sp. NPDC058228]|uniref:tetratricopeptide repeat protein n=1 Tax=Streptomyces sp. NPDC058228 TaxID=3346390 RepID=UPI0036EF78D6
MELDRRVQIRLRTNAGGTQRTKFGSGYLVAPRLVLTAAHVLGDDSGPWSGSLAVTLARSASIPATDVGADARAGPSDQQFPATVRWYRKSDLVDAALVEVDDGDAWPTPESLQDTISRPPQRWGLLIGPCPHPVAVLGFPNMQKDVGSDLRIDEQLSGEIHPGSGSLAHRYEISSTSPVLNAKLSPGAAGTCWSGMSGAAVHSNNMLCGVTRRDLQATGGTRLTATPAALLLADDSFRAIVAEYSSGWEPVLEPVEPAGLFTPAASERDLSSPAALLRADTEAVTFHGRKEELDVLRAWCEDGQPALSVHALTGPGGQGKTRLARHLTDVLGRVGWATGHLRPDLTDLDPPPDFTPLTTALPLLIVVDYAETRPRLLRRLITHLQPSRHRVRILLLARSDGEWRTDALNAAPRTRTLLKEAQITELTALIPLSRAHSVRPDQDRRAAFGHAAAAFARLLPHVSRLPTHDWQALASNLQSADDLKDARYDNILTLQMTALVTLLQHGPNPVRAAPGDLAEEILLHHEERFWEDSADAPAFKLNLPTPVLAKAVAIGALCGAADEDEALRVTKQIPDLPDDKAPRTVAWLATLYPAGSDRYWGSLQPDRIAEYHVSRTLIAGGVALPAVMAAASPGQQGQLFIVLIRAALAHYNARRTADSTDVLRILDIALENVKVHRRALSTVVAALPEQSHVIASLALRLSLNLALVNRHSAAADPANEPSLAGSLVDLGARFAQAGRQTDAVKFADEGVTLFRRLAAADPAAHKPDLARALSNLGISLSMLGQPTGAVKAIQEAVGIYRWLAAANPAAYEPDLARALSNLGARLSAIGQAAEAVRTIKEAVGIQRRLVAANPAVYEPDLAGSLSNLGGPLSHGVGQQAEAVTVIREAVGIQRRLVAANPAVYEPDLAGALDNLGARLLAAGEAAEAVKVTQEAIAIFRRLAETDPAAYEPDLALSLSNSGARFILMGRDARAVKVSEEGTAIFRRLAAADLAAHKLHLAQSISNLGICLPRVGRHMEAMTVTKEAVDMYRQLVAADPAVYEPDLARSLSAFAWTRLMAQQELPGALRATGEAVEIYRRHVEARPAQFAGPLLAVVTVQADLLSNLGNLREAEELRRWLAANAAVLHSLA